MSRTDAVRVSTTVGVDADTAFAVFTSEIDAWWLRGAAFGVPQGHQLRFDADRLVVFRDSGEVRELGRVRAWKPGELLVFTLPPKTSEPDTWTEVEVRFEPLDDGRTRVTVVHRGFDEIPDGASARHGLTSEGFVGMMGRWWRDLLVSLHAHTGRTREGG